MEAADQPQEAQAKPRRPRIYLNLARQPYSKMERQLLRFLLKSGGRISSTRLTAMRQKADHWDVGHPRNIVTVTMRHLMRKVRDNRERFLVQQSERRGPHAVEYWIEWKRR